MKKNCKKIKYKSIKIFFTTISIHYNINIFIYFHLFIIFFIPFNISNAKVYIFNNYYKNIITSNYDY